MLNITRSEIPVARLLPRAVAKLGLRAMLAASFLGSAQVADADTWRGTAPFCDGRCLPGEVEVRRDSSGNGAQCWTGTKVLCRNAEPLCEPRQTRTSCYGFVMVCDDGHYTIPDVWVSCSKYACGACFGFDF